MTGERHHDGPIAHMSRTLYWQTGQVVEGMHETRVLPVTLRYLALRDLGNLSSIRHLRDLGNLSPIGCMKTAPRSSFPLGCYDFVEMRLDVVTVDLVNR